MPQTNSDADLYSREGFLSPIDVLDADEVARYRAEFDALEGELGRDVCSIGLMGRHRDIRFIWELATHPKVLDAPDAVLGPDIVLLSTHIFCKYPAEGPRRPFVAWHQDVTYWGLEPAQAYTGWLALDDADVENGAMRVLPGTHQLGQLEHGKAGEPDNLLSINQAIDPHRLDVNSAVDIELRAGQMSLHDGLLVHGSNPNLSNRRRCGVTLRYTTPNVRIVEEPGRRHQWPPSLVRGKDRYGTIDLLPAPEFAG